MQEWKTAGLAMLIAVTPVMAYGQEPELVTDRPDFTESSVVVAPGMFQFETGWSYERDGRGAGRSSGVVAPASLLRIGMSKRLELRVSSDGWVSDRHAGVRSSGVADLELGVKVRLADQHRAGVDVAVIPMASLPTGSSAFSSGGVDPTVKLTWARDLPSGFGLSGNYNVASISMDAGRFTEHTVSASLSHGLSDRWAAYAETYASSPTAPAGAWTFDTGVTRALGDNGQFDIEIGRGYSDAATDWFVGVGFAIRGHWLRSR